VPRRLELAKEQPERVRPPLSPQKI
jgi:hypothetical protein